MSPASHAVGRLRELYGIVLGRMRALNERQMHPPLGHLQPAARCAMEPLEPRLLLSTTAFLDSFASTTIDPANWTSVSGATVDDVGLSEPSSPYSLRLNGNPGGGDSVTSRVIDLSLAVDAQLSYCYQQTGGGESPDTGDDLIVEYWNAATWQELDRQFGSGGDMDTYVQSSVSLPAGALHGDFRLRIRSIGTAGAYDDWFVDDIRLTATIHPLTVAVPAQATEGDGILAGQGTVSIASALTADLAVTLSSDYTAKANVPAGVTILAGQTSAAFDLTIVDNTDLDGTQAVTILASAADYISIPDTILVHDDETAVLTVTLPASATEGDGTLAGQGQVTVDQAPTADVPV